jgi:hypothetical protein
MLSRRKKLLHYNFTNKTTNAVFVTGKLALLHLNSFVLEIVFLLPLKKQLKDFLKESQDSGDYFRWGIVRQDS